MIENDDEDDLVAQSKNTISITSLYIQPLNKDRVLRDKTRQSRKERERSQNIKSKKGYDLMNYKSWIDTYSQESIVL